ncbi:hypothetical protein BOX15_Mlig010675g1 [Macrostomum lignano]|uniref:Uncharacterized protein n=2 Tax=Macrostomum lignano TaxID=282301 RepID=A0A267GZ78_9PLAT|nr:hypothetical protein BOX15_Mlig010675g1 [Macrostomum lignano]
MTDQKPHKRRRHARSPSEGQRYCRVCGDLAATFNFGQICCESCKAFFRRNAEKHLDCSHGDGNCLITVTTRRTCRACRFEKCLAVGMQLELLYSAPTPASGGGDGDDAGTPAELAAAALSDDSDGSSTAAEYDSERDTKQQQQPSQLNWQEVLSQIIDCCAGTTSGVDELGSDHNHNRRCPNLNFYYGDAASAAAAAAAAADLSARRRDEESAFIGQVTGWLAECVDCDLSVPFDIKHDLRRGLSEQLDSWQDMISQLEIFMQPVIQFCRLFFKSTLLAETAPDWRQEFSVRLVKLRLHALLVPMFSSRLVSGSTGQLQVSIAGSLYNVDPNKSISQLDKSFIPGLSALTANDRYFAYIDRVLESRQTLIGLYSLLKLLDLSELDNNQEPDLADICVRLFVRVSACLRRAFADEFADKWRDKLRELAILFEWSRTFDSSLQTLFNGLGDVSPTPLFSEIYSGPADQVAP